MSNGPVASKDGRAQSPKEGGEDLRVRWEVTLCMSIWDMSTSVLRVGAKVGGMLPVEDLLSSYSTRQC